MAAGVVVNVHNNDDDVPTEGSRTYAIVVCVFAALGGLFFGYDQGVTSGVLIMDSFINDYCVGWHNFTYEQCTASTSDLPHEWTDFTVWYNMAYNLGCLAGAFIGGIVADKLGRRWTIFTAGLLFCIGTSWALGYFESLGFKCPPRRDVADFLLDLGTNKQTQYEVSSIHPVPRSASEYADLFKRSAIYERMMEDLHEPIHPSLIEDQEKHIDPIPEFHQNFWDSTMTVVKRQIELTKRDTAFLFGRSFMVILMGLLYASTFYQFDETNAQLVLGILFTAVQFVSLGQQSQIPVFMAAREVFYKQRRANFFRTTSFVLSNSVTQFPLGLMESLVFGSIVYWMCGCVSTVEAFILFEMILLLLNLSFTAWFFFLSCASPNLNVANPVSMVSILFFVLFAGFVITKEQIPDYLIWIYWIDPMTWGLRALAVNQYSDDSFDTCVYNGIDYCANYNMTMGEYSLTTFEIQTEKSWIWYGLVYMAAAYVFFMFLSCIALEYHRFENPENVTLDSEHKGSASDDYGLMNTPRSSPNGSDAVVTIGHDREKHFTPVTVAFKDLWYTVPDPANPKDTIDLLKGISGYALPGTITALMGSSGAGKTTLMDVIAGRKTGGKITGQILLNGHPATDLSIRRSTGYCEQMDIHSESATIREALTFSAFLPNPRRADAEQQTSSENGPATTKLVGHDAADESASETTQVVRHVVPDSEVRPLMWQVRRGSGALLVGEVVPADAVVVDEGVHDENTRGHTLVIAEKESTQSGEDAYDDGISARTFGWDVIVIVVDVHHDASSHCRLKRS
ncbi:hypothetical protein PPTG_22527 [Phytophthora nicotianae INRA-310]|uniref:ABC transporter domain-containing protein n=4 Tax=Phytophthora nicotianae TaxID=4792 RepID=W2QEU2_PHYN3|nr:hypothetical protein PPTG_22527 [Phytophthora nicotianae INRA-310]ETN11718.1 hypothetical protein PPTG_22527 [Phytophthora nicotianae INRA-310]